MGKLSAWSLLYGSVVVIFSGAAFASGSAALPKSLEQRDLTNPARVTAWLKENAATADKPFARRFFDHALKDKARKAWGPAAKGFCESALFYPMPDALSECANADAHSLGNTRAREKSYAQKSRSDMQSIESLYRSAIAVDAVLNVMNEKEKEQLRQNADCLAAFVRTKEMQPDCQPLQAYGLK